MGIGKGITFVLISMLLQNIIFIPAILALAVSGFKLYKSIVKDNRKENVKSSLVETLISTNLLKIFIKYF